MRAGQELEPVSLDLTLQRLVMMSSANRDFAPTHVDDAAARASGAPAAYADMISVFALFERAALAHGGTRARLARLADVRLRTFVVHGQSATVLARVVAADAREARLDLALVQDAGTPCATATAVLELRPEEEPA